MTMLMHVNDATIPEKVDLRDVLWPVENTGDTTAAAASALATALEYHLNRIGEQPADLSTLFIHYNARKLAGPGNEWTGSSIQDAMKAVATFGVCREQVWPFDPKNVNTEPPADVYEAGKRFAKVEFAHPVDPFQALSLRYPLPFITKLPTRLMSGAWQTGVMPPLTPEEQQNLQQCPGHAMVLVGYDKQARTYTARNCWGTQFGRDGHCQISFDLLNILAPVDSGRIFLITSPQTAQNHSPLGRGAMDAPAPAPAPEPETLASMAARMKAEITGDLQRDLADAIRRVREKK